MRGKVVWKTMPYVGEQRLLSGQVVGQALQCWFVLQ
jgi:hypothetical protein